MKQRISLFILITTVFPSTLFALNGVHVEAELSESSPYVRQKFIYSLRVVSSISLSKVNVVPPSISGVVLEKAEGPHNSYRTGKEGQQLVVNEYRYLLTPLTAGYTEIPPAQVEVTPSARRNYTQHYYNPWQQQQYSSYVSEYEAPNSEYQLSSNSVVLTIRPPISDEAHWLPLYQAEIYGELLGDTERVIVGKPLTLRLTFRATGVGGDGLPSLAQFFQTPDFKLYSERPITTQKLTPDGETLYGQRKETFTLIPKQTGMLELPEIRVPWWDLYNRRPAEATWRHPVLNVVDSMQEETSATTSNLDRRESINFSVFGLLFLGLLVFTAGWWLGAGRPALPLSVTESVGRAWSLFRVNASRLLGGLRRLLKIRIPRTAYARVYDNVRRNLPVRRSVPARRTSRILPTALLSKQIHQFVARLTPRPIKTWLLMRRVGRETDPVVIAKLLQDYAQYALKLPPNTPLHTIATGINDRYPHLDGNVAKSLFTTLDTAIYGGNQMDSKQWHKAFRWLFMRMLMGRRYKPHLIDVIGLPELNP